MSISKLVALGCLCLMLSVCAGCPEPRDPLAEHLLEQRNKAVKQLEERAQRDKTLDILFWDITEVMTKPATIQKWTFGQKDLDVVALTGPDQKKLQLAANMQEVLLTLERGWPSVASTSHPNNKPPVDPTQFSLINANGYRFDGVTTDPVTGWEQADGGGRPDVPPVLHLQFKHTTLEVVLVYLTNMQAVNDAQFAAISKWIDAQNLPTIVFGDFPADKLSSSSLVPMRAGVSVSKSAQTWQVHVEEVESPLGKVGPQPIIIRCKEIGS